ncbi:MAG TPA: hypothetical protein VKE94_10220 [Gemmataceae bacterium]|nr:hypothetical protein [Gemmataceae bacterium]
MIYACDDCAREKNLSLRCPVGDGPFACWLCGRRKAVAVYSQATRGLPDNVSATGELSDKKPEEEG